MNLPLFLLSNFVGDLCGWCGVSGCLQCAVQPVSHVAEPILRDDLLWENNALGACLSMGEGPQFGGHQTIWILGMSNDIVTRFIYPAEEGLNTHCPIGEKRPLLLMNAWTSSLGQVQPYLAVVCRFSCRIAVVLHRSYLLRAFRGIEQPSWFSQSIFVIVQVAILTSGNYQITLAKLGMSTLVKITFQLICIFSRRGRGWES